MNTPKDTDLREALRRKYANTPQLRSDFKLGLPRGGEKKRRHLRRWLYPISAVAAILVIAFILWPDNSKIETPVVAEVVEPEIVEQETSQPVTEPAELPESSEVSKPIKVHKPSRVHAKPLLAEAEKMPEEAEVEMEQEYLPTELDPILLAAAFEQDIRSRGDRLRHEIAQAKINP